MNDFGIAEARGDYLWVTFPESLPLKRIHELERKVIGMIGDPVHNIIIDLSPVSVLYSSGIGLLIRLRKIALKAGGTASLVNVCDSVRRLLLSFNFDRVFSIYATDVEFELTQDEVWKKHLESRFLFLPEVEKGIGRIVLSGRMTAGQDFSVCRSFSPAGNVGLYVFDMSGLEMIDSYGYGVLLSVIKAIREKGAECRVFGASQVIRDILWILGAGDFLTFFGSEMGALTG